jgi:hypothetical protein
MSRLVLWCPGPPGWPEAPVSPETMPHCSAVPQMRWARAAPAWVSPSCPRSTHSTRRRSSRVSPPAWARSNHHPSPNPNHSTGKSSPASVPRHRHRPRPSHPMGRRRHRPRSARPPMEPTPPAWLLRWLWWRSRATAMSRAAIPGRRHREAPTPIQHATSETAPRPLPGLATLATRPAPRPGARRTRAAHQPRPPTPSQTLRGFYRHREGQLSPVTGRPWPRDSKGQRPRAWRFQKGVSGARRHPAPAESPAAVTSRRGPTQARSTQVIGTGARHDLPGADQKLPRWSPGATQLPEIPATTSPASVTAGRP